MSIRCMVSWVVVGILVGVMAVPLRADPMADGIRQVRQQVVPSTVIVSFYVERDDGARADFMTIGTVVGPNNLVMFSSTAIAAQFALAQFHEFQVVIAKGDDLQTFDAEYLGKDDQAQVAFLRVTDPKAPNLPVLTFDHETPVEVGDPVLTLSSLGEPDGWDRLVQLARVCGRTDQPTTLYLASPALGSPGTPILTLDGKAIGIVGFTRLNRATNARPNWTVVPVVWPTARFLERIQNPPQGGIIVKHPWLGVHTLTPVTKDMAEYFNLGDRRGVVIGHVVENGPAAKAGLKAGDIILAVNGEAVKGTEGQLVDNFTYGLRERPVGEKIDLEIWRDTKTETVNVQLDEEPKGAAEVERYQNTPFGLTVRELVLADTIVRELPTTETGVVVAFLAPAGWAQDGGLQEGDIVKKVQDREVRTLADFQKIFEEEIAKKPKEIVLFVLRGKKETQLLRIEPRWDAAATPPADTAPAQPTPPVEEGKS